MLTFPALLFSPRIGIIALGLAIFPMKVRKSYHEILPIPPPPPTSGTPSYPFPQARATGKITCQTNEATLTPFEL